ncbi:MAG: uracil-DNA glycosylase [Patescibacteria group bacterium]
MINYKDEIYKLKEKCYSCKKCTLGQELVDGEDPHVFANGRVPAEIIFIAEAGGAEEVRQKLPLVGRSGQFYNDKILTGAGLSREEVYTTNTCHCRPPGNRNPLPNEIEACREFLDAEIYLHDPKLIITLGNIPLYGVCETTGITKKRGVIILSRTWSNGKQYPVFPMLHPSYCLRGSGHKEMAEDIEKLKNIVIKINNGEMGERDE